MVGIFSFSSLNISSHSCLAYNASAAISADSLMRVVLYKIHFFSCCFKNCLFSSLILHNFIVICLEEDCLALKIWGNLSAWWTWMSKPLSRFGKFSPFFLYFLKKYFFIFGYAGSQLLLGLSSSCSECSVWASHRSGFSSCGAWAPGAGASVVVGHEMNNCSLWALECGLTIFFLFTSLYQIF